VRVFNSQLYQLCTINMGQRLRLSSILLQSRASWNA
jgi:hypothetical protein